MEETDPLTSNSKELDFYDQLLSFLESRVIGNWMEKQDELLQHTEYLMHGLELQLMADPIGVFIGTDATKLRCCELLSRMIRLRRKTMAMEIIKDDIIQTMHWNMLLNRTITHLEQLFVFFCEMDFDEYF